jgi:ribonucleoside-diphosphate reductase alpha chain
MKDDSIMGIYETLKDCAAISQHAGGIGLSIHKIRAKGSIIRGTNGTSNGIVPMLRNFNATARYVDQCFTPDTLVRVADDTNIPICDVKEGGDILTSLGFRKVLKNVIHEYDGQIVQLKMDTGAVVRVTDTHPVLAVKSHGNDMNQLRKAIAAKVLVPEFTDIKELEVGDYLIDFPNWNRIVEINSQPYTGQVHDFEIEAPHDYYVNGLGFAHNGGGKRNGSFAIYLEPWHADIEDFLKLKLNTGMEEDRARDLFYALWIPDLFMKRVEANVDWTVFCPDEAPGLDDVWGDAFEALYTKYEAEGRGRKKINAQKLWFQILDAQIETGTPYLLYKDAANAKSNQQNLGTIKSSNLCVAPETMILTDKGHKQIHELENKEVTLWNGDAWSKATVRKTGVNQKLISVLLSNGAEIHCTPYHKFLVRDSYKDKDTLKECKRIDASELVEGMKLAKCDLPLVEGNATEDIPFPYTHGFFCGDGTYHTQSSGNRYPAVALYGEKKKLMSYLEIRSTTGVETAQGLVNCLLPTDLAEKYYVPMNASLRCRLEWFAGLLDADGTVAHNGDNESLQIGSINFEFLDNIRLMLQTLGIQSKVTRAFDARQTLLPDGKGGRKLYECQPLWRLLVSSTSLYRLDALGLDCKRLVIKGNKPQRNAEQFVTVVSVTDMGRTDDTYCFNEPLNHAGIFNGILTGNCTEIIEYSAPDETAVCNLASISLPSCVVTADGVKSFDFDELRKIVSIAVRNLNRVIDINYYPTPETEKSNMRHRPVGLGIQGLADVFALLKYDWESAEAARLNQLIFEYMYFEAVSESARIAQVEGSYSTFAGSPTSQGRLQPDMWNVVPITEKEGTLDWASLRLQAQAGMRNSLLVAPMPTASTSQILGNNECFEPFTTNIYSRRTLAGEFTVLNKYLLAELREAGLWSEGLKNEIIARNGSVQGIEAIPADVQARYKTTWEIKQRTLIDMARDRGAFIDQSQSLNLFVADPTYSKLTSMHFYAWKSGLKTGCYYLRSKAPVVAQQFTVDPRLLSAISSGGKVADLSSDSEDDDSEDDEGDTPLAPVGASAPVTSQQPLTKAEERRLLLERLSAEYEAEQAKGCTMCSS